MSVQVLCPFFNWVVCLPDVESCVFFCVFSRSNSCLQYHLQIYVPYNWSSFHFADVFFIHAEAFYFDEVPFVYSFLYVPCSGIVCNREKELLSFATAWMDLENTVLSEISQVVKEIYQMISPISGT